MSAAVTALAPWFGSKRTMAPDIVKLLGPHKSYWEPFCGSMAVLLNKPKCRMETVGDLHADLVNLARVVRDTDAGQELYRQARLMLCSDDELASANKLIRSGDCPEELNVERALAYLSEHSRVKHLGNLSPNKPKSQKSIAPEVLLVNQRDTLDLFSGGAE